jgi:host factor-I protein
MRPQDRHRDADFRSSDHRGGDRGDRGGDPGEDEQDGGPRREAEYLRQLADQRTRVVVRLTSGESFNGFIEYYDKGFIRLTREGAPNLFIYKHDIKYLFEE